MVGLNCYDSVVRASMYSGSCYDSVVRASMYSGSCYDSVVRASMYSGSCLRSAHISRSSVPHEVPARATGTTEEHKQ